MKRLIKKNNEEQILRVNMICNETRHFIEDIEDGLLNSNTTDSRIFQFIECLKKETEKVSKNYSDYLERCTNCLVIAGFQVVDWAKFQTEDIKKRLIDYCTSCLSPNSTTTNKASANLSGNFASEFLY